MKARALRVTAKAATVAELALTVEEVDLPEPPPGMALVQVAAAGVNPSDVKATLGLMPYAVFPRTTGRDFAGTVLTGEHAGQAVFGSSGDLGIRRDGTHATHLLVETAALVAMPDTLTLAEAAGIGVPFVTAAEGLRRAGLPQPGESVLVMGVNGKVGQAAAQIASWRGARVLGVVRREESYAGHASSPVTVIDSASSDVAACVRDLTDGRGADIVYNTVGDPYYPAAVAAMAKGGRLVLIASSNAQPPFDIFGFYRGRHTYVGIDTLAFSSAETAQVLRSLLPGFASGALRPFPVATGVRYTLANAHDAFVAVLGASRDRIVLVPG